jgi:N-acetyl-anhydromuramyl-L-alanine amidase AmpD
LAGQPAAAAPIPPFSSGTSPLAAAFDAAASRHAVPRDLLVALGYAETHLDGHAGAPSASGGYGIMHLVRNPQHRTLDEAAVLTGRGVDELRADTAANIDGAAAVLAAYADDAKLSSAARGDVNAWYGVVARYGGAASPATARLYADAVYDLLASGLGAGGVSVAPRAVAPARGALAAAPAVGIESTDYPPARFVAANSGNYTAANRETEYNINYVVIHVTQGSYAGTISWFQNDASNVSAHYVVRSSDGEVTQMVRDKDVAWHAGNWTINTQSIGIEHEGFVDNASWFTDAMYRASAALTRYMCDKYAIPRDRAHIIGHVEVPGATHTDPGPHWNWSYYMSLVNGTTPPPTWTQTVDNSDTANFTAGANWSTSTYSTQRFGADYRYASTVELSDPAWYRFNVPATASYRVEVWYPALPGYNSAAPYIIATPSGNQVVYVDQRSGGGAWRSIGTFTLAAGDANVVAVSRWTSGTGLVIADAIKLTRV